MGHHLVFFSRFKSHQHLIAGGAPGERLQRPGLSRGSSKRAGAEERPPLQKTTAWFATNEDYIYNNNIYIYIYIIYHIIIDIYIYDI